MVGHPTDSRWGLVAVVVPLSLMLTLAGVGKLLSEEAGTLSIVLGGDSRVWRRIWLTGEFATPWLELLAGVTLWVRPVRRAGAWIGLLLGVVFVVVAVILPVGVDCGCFGILGGLESRQWRLVVASCVMAVSAYLIVAYRHGRADSRP